MWFEPEKYRKVLVDHNKELWALKGEITEKQARIAIAKYFRRNIGACIYFLTGITLAPYQIITIKGMLNRNNTLCVWGRGVGKTFCAAVYCILQMIFEPGSNILIAGPTFRTARFIFNHIEKIVARPEAQLLMDCFGAKSKRNDEFKWAINGGEIIAIPLNGEKIRGFRANILVIDEFLLMSEEIVEKVLLPFLVSPQDVGERIKTRKDEDEKIEQGEMQEADKKVFKDKAKFIALSSASYQCEYLYRKYDEFIKKIYENDSKDEATYFVSQMGWDSIPPEMMDKGVIELASSNEANAATFKREYQAQFIDGSDSYFSMNKMIACTVPDGQEPTLLLSGDKNKKYILAIDPNASNSATADFFAMCVIEMDDDFKGGTVVHNYATAGKDLKDHVLYLYYILTNFNIELIIIDYAGYQFIETANENELFRKVGLDLKIFEFYAEKDGAELEEQLKFARRLYNKQIQRIVFTQLFSTDSIRKMNENLQGFIDYKKIWFGGAIKGNLAAFNKATSFPLDLKLVDAEDRLSFIDRQEILLKQAKYQCASIVVSTSSRGVQSFDLPQIMKRDTSSKRARKDSYTALMLGTWGIKAYHDIMNVPEEQHETFTPFFIN
jgi:hypothetical protein